jgi:hypothetical protein
MLLLQRLDRNFHLLKMGLLVPFLTLAEERNESIFKLIDAGLTVDLSNAHERQAHCTCATLVK